MDTEPGRGFGDKVAAAISISIPKAGWTALLPLSLGARSRRSCVRFWEQNGSGGTLPGAVRSGHCTGLYVSDVQERRIAVALPGCALSSHRGGQGFKSPQLHRVLAGQTACSISWLSVGEPMWEPSRRIIVWLGLCAVATAKTVSTSTTGATAGTAPCTGPGPGAGAGSLARL